MAESRLMSARRRVDPPALTARRIREPGAVAQAWADRAPARRPADGRLLLIAADHPARGALGVRADARAMASRTDLLGRLEAAVARPGVDGVLGTPDILEDLLLAGLLDGRVVIGSMNRGGLQGASFELDDRFTAYDAATITRFGLDGGKMLTRVCLDDPGTASTLEASGHAVDRPRAAAQKMAMVEPFLSGAARRPGGQPARPRLGDPFHSCRRRPRPTSAFTWLKLPVVTRCSACSMRRRCPRCCSAVTPRATPTRPTLTWATSTDLPGSRWPRGRAELALSSRRRRRREQSTQPRRWSMEDGIDDWLRAAGSSGDASGTCGSVPEIPGGRTPACMP
jgi:hypothetical protein